MRTIKAYSKPTHEIKQKMMHGNIYAHKEGEQDILYIITDKSDEEITDIAKSKCEKLGVELWKVIAIGSKPTSFNTNATWCDAVIYEDNTNAIYFEGVFDEMGNKVE